MPGKVKAYELQSKCVHSKLWVGSVLIYWCRLGPRMTCRNSWLIWRMSYWLCGYRRLLAVQRPSSQRCMSPSSHSAIILKSDFVEIIAVSQLHSPQIDRKSFDSDESKGTPKLAWVLQRQEVPTSWSPSEEDTGNQAADDKGTFYLPSIWWDMKWLWFYSLRAAWVIAENTQAKEEGHPLPNQKIRRQGMMSGRNFMSFGVVLNFVIYMPVRIMTRYVMHIWTPAERHRIHWIPDASSVMF